jgi:hypothetical protein
MEIKNADVKGHLNGGFEIGGFKMFNFTSLEIVGLSLKVELGVERDEYLENFWQVRGMSHIDFEDI